MKSLKPFIITVCCIAATVMLAGCPSQSSGPQEETATVRSNMQPDSTVGWLYYSLDGDSVVPPELAGTATWDIRMAFLLCCGQTRQVDVFLNSGTAGVGTTSGALVSSRFENLTSIPSGLIMKSDDTSSTTRIVPVAVLGSNVMFVYDASTHTINPSPDRCLVIKTSAGNSYKFQFTSIYQDAVPTPSLMTPLGYYQFRYQRIH